MGDELPLPRAGGGIGGPSCSGKDFYICVAMRMYANWMAGGWLLLRQAESFRNGKLRGSRQPEEEDGQCLGRRMIRRTYERRVPTHS